MPKYVVDLAMLKRKPPTIGESRRIAEIGGLKMSEMTTLNVETMSLPALIAVAFVIIRRTHPTFTMTDLDNLDWDDIDWIDTSAEADPTTAPVIEANSSKPGA